MELVNRNHKENTNLIFNNINNQSSSAYLSINLIKEDEEIEEKEIDNVVPDIPSCSHSHTNNIMLNYYNELLFSKKLQFQHIINDITSAWYFNSGTFITSAPGKILLCGEHSVLYNKLAIAASIDKRTYAEFNHLEELKLSISIELKREEFKTVCWEFPLEPLKIISDKYRIKPSDRTVSESFKAELNELICGIVSDQTILPQQNKCLVCLLMLYIVFTAASTGLQIRVWSELPLACGLGSSASFAACLSGAFMYMRPDLSLCNCWENELAPEFCLHSKELINQWAFEVEMILHGRASGIDNACSVYGGGISFLNSKTNKIELIPEFPPLRFLIMNTKISRNTQQQIQKVNNVKLKLGDRDFAKLMDALDDNANEIYHLITKYGNSILNCEQQYDHLNDNLKRLIIRNQEYLNKLDISNSAIDELLSVTRSYDIGAKLTGAGGGGCVIALLYNIKDVKMRELKKELLRRNYEIYECIVGSPYGLTIDFKVLDRTKLTPKIINYDCHNIRMRKLTI